MGAEVLFLLCGCVLIAILLQKVNETHSTSGATDCCTVFKLAADIATHIPAEKAFLQNAAAFVCSSGQIVLGIHASGSRFSSITNSLRVSGATASDVDSTFVANDEQLPLATNGNELRQLLLPNVEGASDDKRQCRLWVFSNIQRSLGKGAVMSLKELFESGTLLDEPLLPSTMQRAQGFSELLADRSAAVRGIVIIVDPTEHQELENIIPSRVAAKVETFPF